MQACPAKAIYPQPLVLQDGHEQILDYQKCAQVFAATFGCSMCIKECVLSQRDPAQLRKNFAQGIFHPSSKYSEQRRRKILQPMVLERPPESQYLRFDEKRLSR
ncbi:MAG: hypothetical protein J7M05_04650 [Anaerolineae bacterium]|nr:hypothetical protein [Anaerolineae bacterium]